MLAAIAEWLKGWDTGRMQYEAFTDAKATLLFADGSPYKHPGKLNFVDVYRRYS
jgi:hypothetical protein